MRSHSFEQCLVLVQPTPYRSSVEKPGVVVAIERKTVLGFHTVEKNIKVHKALCIWIDLGFQPVQIKRPTDPFKIELDLCQRQSAWIALQRQLTNQPSVGVILVFVARQD